jgi:hypothetical protein
MEQSAPTRNATAKLLAACLSLLLAIGAVVIVVELANSVLGV